jgi:alpha-mannosidase
LLTTLALTPFLSHYSSVNLSSALYLDEDGSKEAVKLESWSPKAGTSPTFAEAARAHYKPAKVGDEFGPSWSNHWFKVSLTVPKGWRDYERIQFEFDPDCEGLIFTPEGIPVHALVGGFDNLRRVEFVLEGAARKPGATTHFFIEISCNGMFGVPQGGAEIQPPDVSGCRPTSRRLAPLLRTRGAR